MINQEDSYDVLVLTIQMYTLNCIDNWQRYNKGKSMSYELREIDQQVKAIARENSRSYSGKYSEDYYSQQRWTQDFFQMVLKWMDLISSFERIPKEQVFVNLKVISGGKLNHMKLISD